MLLPSALHCFASCLSTAAHNSARFPIISPAGEIRNRQHQIVDRIVDGGYFENYGALGAMELAQAIRAIEPKLSRSCW